MTTVLKISVYIAAVEPKPVIGNTERKKSTEQLIVTLFAEAIIRSALGYFMDLTFGLYVHAMYWS